MGSMFSIFCDHRVIFHVSPVLKLEYVHLPVPSSIIDPLRLMTIAPTH